MPSQSAPASHQAAIAPTAEETRPDALGDAVTRFGDAAPIPRATMHEVGTPVVAIRPRGERTGKRLEDGKGWWGSQGQADRRAEGQLAEARLPFWRRWVGKV